MTPEVAIGQRASDRPDSATRWLVIGLTASPLFWFLGFHLFWFHLVAFFSLLALQTETRKPGIQAGIFALIPLALSFVSAASLVANASNIESGPLFGATYQISYWLMGAAVCEVAANANWRHLRAALFGFSTQLGLIALGSCAIVLFAWFVVGMTDLSFPTLLGMIGGPLNDIHIFAETTHYDLLRPDFIDGTTRPRLTLLGPYPVVTAALAAIALAAIFEKYARKRVPSLIWWVTLLGLLAALWLTRSRMVFLAMLLTYSATFLVRRRIFWPVAIILAILGLLFAPILMNIISEILASRNSSTLTRFELYQYAIKQLVGTNAFIGVGAVERISSFDIPVGSHSTVLGAFYKSGLLGGALTLLLIFSTTVYWFWATTTIHLREERNYIIFLGSPIILINLILFTEDIDWPQLLCFLYFLLIGTLVSTVSNAQRRQTLHRQGRPLDA